MLYDVKSIRKKALRLYESGDVFHAFIEETALFPYTIKLKKPTQKSLRESIQTLSGEIKSLEKLHLYLNYQEFDFKSIGKQRLPVSIVIQTQEDLLRLLGKLQEFKEFVEVYRESVEAFTSLKLLFLQKPNLLLQNRDIVTKVLTISKFLLQNPQPNIYIRELPIKGLDTKFIEKNRVVVDSFLENVLDKSNYDTSITRLLDNGFEKKYGLKYELPLVRFRILDEDLCIQGLSDMSLTTEEFEALNLECENIFIVENKITMLSFMDMKNSIVIFGNGYGAGRIKNAKWLESKNIYYWGDIDMDGFAILSQVRGYFPQTKSLMMDDATIRESSDLAVASSERSFKNLECLTQDERVIYERLFSDYYGNNFRLEQEKILLNYVGEKIDAIR